MESSLGLGDDELPAAYRGADAASLRGQKDALRLLRWGLRLGLIAAAGGITTWRVGDSQLDVLAGASTVAFALSLYLGVKVAADRAEDRWYLGRAAAESVKTLAWRYAVGGDPFPVLMPLPSSDELLTNRIHVVLTSAIDRVLDPAPGDQITQQMRSLREAPFDERQSRYIAGRIEQQRGWYLWKAELNAQSARRWGWFAAGANVVGFIGAGCRFLGWVEIDLLGIAAAAAGAGTGWAHLRQHRVLATSYALTAQELGLVRERLASVSDEATWALEVSDAEDAISREHIMWLARRGHPRLA